MEFVMIGMVFVEGCEGFSKLINPFIGLAGTCIGGWNLNPTGAVDLWPPSLSLGIGGKAGLAGWPPDTLRRGGGPGLGAPRSVLTLRPPVVC